MKMIVVGAGQVGGGVARELSDTHEIVVIDHDPEKLEQLRYGADVMTVEGNGADIDVLERAGPADADIVIASTDDDRANILVCGIANALHPEVFAIARVANSGYLKSWKYSRQAFSVDLMVGSDYLTARSMVQIVYQHMARSVAYFDRGRVEMAEFRVPAGSHLAGKAVRDVDIYEGLRYAAVFHGDDDFEVARGDTIIRPDCRLVVIGRSEDVHDFGRELGEADSVEISRAFILGGSEIAYQAAQLMEQRALSPKVVVADEQRAHMLASNLPDTFVLHDDPMDPDFLRSEGLARAQVVIVALDTDQDNLFASLQAVQLGAERVISVVHGKQYEPLFEFSGIDVTFNPRNKIIEEIIRYTRARTIEKVAFVEHHQGEVIEVKLQEGTPLAARTVEEVAPDFPDGVVIGAISRSGRVIIPSGETVLEVGDDLVLFVAADVVEDVLELL